MGSRILISKVDAQVSCMCFNKTKRDELVTPEHL